MSVTAPWEFVFPMGSATVGKTLVDGPDEYHFRFERFAVEPGQNPTPSVFVTVLRKGTNHYERFALADGQTVDTTGYYAYLRAEVGHAADMTRARRVAGQMIWQPDPFP